MPRAIKALFADVDGTCVFCESRNQRAIEMAAENGGFTLSDDHWEWFIGAGDKVIFGRIVEALSDDTSALEQFLAVHPTAEDFELACLDNYYRMRDQITANPPVYSMVQDFMNAAVPVIPVSNAMRTAVYDNLEVTGYPVSSFPFILSKDDVEAVGLNPKPEPDPYRYALKLHNRDRTGRGLAPLQPEDCMVVEDSRTGARAGVSAGMNTVHLVDDEKNMLAPEEVGTGRAVYKPCYHHELADAVQHIHPRLATRRPDCGP